MAFLKNSALNVVGLGAPLLAALFSIPILVSSLGPDRFGILTLIWAVVSYFGFFDLGLGRALTQQLAVLFDRHDNNSAGTCIGTALLLLLVLGILSGFALAIAASPLMSMIRDIPNEEEVLRSIYAMSIAMPAVIVTSGLRGILEAAGKFWTINIIRVPMGLFTFIGPLIVVWLGYKTIDAIAYVLVAGRIIALLVHIHYVWFALPDGCKLNIRPQFAFLRSLCTAGGWLTVSNVISPFMGYVDRFIIGGAVSASAIAYYSVPYEAVTKLWILPTALTAALFPELAAIFARRSTEISSIVRKAVLVVAAVILPLCILIALNANLLLSKWINPTFAHQSYEALQILCIGMIPSALASVPYTAIQSNNQARLTALIHLVELPVFIVLIYYLTIHFGIVGAASAWTLRATADAIIMFSAYYHMKSKLDQTTKHTFTSKDIRA